MVFDTISRRSLLQPAQHHDAGHQHRRRVHLFIPHTSGADPCTASEDRTVVPDIGARRETQPSHALAQRSVRISPYKFGSTRQSELSGIPHELHAAVVYDDVPVS